jgi:hypothetical protein
MSTKANRERDFEKAIEAHRIGHGGHEQSGDADFDPEKALIPATLIRFVPRWMRTKPTGPPSWTEPRPFSCLSIISRSYH